MDDLAERLDLIIAAVEGARAMPLSDSCLINRTELLAALEDLRARLPERLDEADRILAERDAIIADAYQRAAAIVAEGSREGARLASSSAVVRQAESDAAAIMAAARQASDEMRGQADSYVDGKLADFEDLLARTLASVRRGRERLATRGALARGAGLRRMAEAGAPRAVHSSSASYSSHASYGSHDLRDAQEHRDGQGGGPVLREPVSGHVRITSGPSTRVPSGPAPSAGTPGPAAADGAAGAHPGMGAYPGGPAHPGVPSYPGAAVASAAFAHAGAPAHPDAAAHPQGAAHSGVPAQPTPEAGGDPGAEAGDRYSDGYADGYSDGYAESPAGTLSSGGTVSSGGSNGASAGSGSPAGTAVSTGAGSAAPIG